MAGAYGGLAARQRRCRLEWWKSRQWRPLRGSETRRAHGRGRDRERTSVAERPVERASIRGAALPARGRDGNAARGGQRRVKRRREMRVGAVAARARVGKGDCDY